MFQNFLVKTMLKNQLKHIPQEQQDQLLSMIEKNPDFFMAIAKEVQEKMKSGQSQQDAMMAVIESHKDELKGMLN